MNRLLMMCLLTCTALTAQSPADYKISYKDLQLSAYRAFTPKTIKQSPGFDVWARATERKLTQAHVDWLVFIDREKRVMYPEYLAAPAVAPTFIHWVALGGTYNPDGYRNGSWGLISADGTLLQTYQYTDGVQVSRVPAPLPIGLPVAAFDADPLQGPSPLTVQFTGNNVAGNIDSWAWAFGDGGTSTVQSPSHIYTAIGPYTTELTVTNAAGSRTAIQTITVTDGGVVTPPPPPTAGLPTPVSSYAFDGASSSAIDSSGTRTGTLFGGAVKNAAGKYGSCVKTSTLSDGVEFGPVNFPGDQFSVSCWVQHGTGGANDPRYFSKCNGQNTRNFVVMLGSQSMFPRVRIQNAAGISAVFLAGSGRLQTGIWAHLAMVYDGTTVKVYKDGVQVMSHPFTGTLLQNAWKVKACNSDVSNRTFNGRLDNLRVYSVALTDEQVGLDMAGAVQ